MEEELGGARDALDNDTSFPDEFSTIITLIKTGVIINRKIIT